MIKPLFELPVLLQEIDNLLEQLQWQSETEDPEGYQATQSDLNAKVAELDATFESHGPAMAAWLRYRRSQVEEAQREAARVNLILSRRVKQFDYAKARAHTLMDQCGIVRLPGLRIQANGGKLPLTWDDPDRPVPARLAQPVLVSPGDVWQVIEHWGNLELEGDEQVRLGKLIQLAKSIFPDPFVFSPSRAHEQMAQFGELPLGVSRGDRGSHLKIE